MNKQGTLDMMRESMELAIGEMFDEIERLKRELEDKKDGYEGPFHNACDMNRDLLSQLASEKEIRARLAQERDTLRTALDNLKRTHQNIIVHRKGRLSEAEAVAELDKLNDEAAAQRKQLAEENRNLREQLLDAIDPAEYRRLKDENAELITRMVKAETEADTYKLERDQADKQLAEVIQQRDNLQRSKDTLATWGQGLEKEIDGLHLEIRGLRRSLNAAFSSVPYPDLREGFENVCCAFEELADTMGRKLSYANSQIDFWRHEAKSVVDAVAGSHTEAIENLAQAYEELADEYQMQETVFDLQHKRVAAAVEEWRKQNPGHELTLPDLGTLMQHLLAMWLCLPEKKQIGWHPVLSPRISRQRVRIAKLEKEVRQNKSLQASLKNQAREITILRAQNGKLKESLREASSFAQYGKGTVFSGI